MTEAPLIDTWRKLLDSGIPGLHLVDPTHPLQIFVGTTDSGSPRLVIRSIAKPARPTLSNVVLVERQEDQGAKWNLILTLQDRKFDEVFLRLADDVHARSMASPNEKTALDRVSVVIDEWRRLLKPRPTGLLSMEELRGLIGELWLLLNAFTAGRSIEAAVAGWLGPMGLPQDFWYTEDGFHEVKAIGPSTVRVKISSEHQLDAADLELVVLRIANTDEQTLGSLNLPRLVNSVHAALSDAAVSSDAFDDRLSRLGVDLAEAFYQDTWFAMARLTTYDVGEEFPAIRASQLPSGISRVKYQIELAEITDFVQGNKEVS